MNYQLASAIIKGKWAIDPQFAISSLPVVSDILAGNIEIEHKANENNEPVAVILSKETGKPTYHTWEKAPKGSIALIKLSGTLFKDDQDCGPVGMASIGSYIQEADINSNFDGILLVIDSPGGTVDGTQTLSNIVKSVSKPIITFIDGLMASAALWIGSSADEIIASTEFDEIGSIGVLLSFADFQPAYEKEGVKFHNIVAPQSTEKIKMWEDIRNGKYDEYKKDVLQPLAEEFINAMKLNRPLVDEKHLKGKVFFAKDVKGVFIDDISNIEKALNRLSQRISENKTNSNNNSNSITMKKFETINKIAGAELEATDDGVFLNEGQLGLINSSLEQGAKIEDDLETAKADKVKAEDDLKTANETIQEKDNEIAELKKNAGAETAKVISEKETDTDVKDQDKNVTNDKKDFLENLNAVEKEFL